MTTAQMQQYFQNNASQFAHRKATSKAAISNKAAINSKAACTRPPGRRWDVSAAVILSSRTRCGASVTAVASFSIDKFHYRFVELNRHEVRPQDVCHIQLRVCRLP